MLKYVLIIIFVIICGIFILHKLIFAFKPKNAITLYKTVIAHRGLHLFAPENSLAAYQAAIMSNMAIELDVRCTRDKQIVCFHDRYTKRLLNIPGKLSMFDLSTIKKYKILGSNEYVPLLQEVFDLVDGKVDLLVEVKGKIYDEYKEALIKLAQGYNGKLFFHTKNICTYFTLRKCFKYSDEKRVYLVLNIFRRRFQFVKGSDYTTQVKKYNELSSNIDVQIPSVEDISSIIVKSIEELEDKKEILATIGEAINHYETRVTPKHWVYNSLWLHRGIVSNKHLEHSKESFKECIKYAKKNNIAITIEFDVMLYKGEVRCYHNDRISSILGQKKSCAEKLKLENSLRLSEVLKLFKGQKNINLAIDIKDYHIRNRVLEDLIILEIKKSGYTGNFIIMSYNPLVLSYFKTVEPDWLRAQIGHSLKGLRKVPFFRFPWVLNGVLGILFDMCSADCVVFDNSNWIYYLICYHKNIRGKPVLIYAPTTFMEQEAFIGKDSVANFIIENAADEASWPKEYLKKFEVN